MSPRAAGIGFLIVAAIGGGVWWVMSRKSPSPSSSSPPSAPPATTSAPAAPKPRPFALADLHPAMQTKWLELERRVGATGLRIKATSGLRPGAEQDLLYAQGRTLPGKIVTNARAGESAHNKGAAVDWAFVKTDGRLSWAEDEPWEQVGAIAESIGLKWGGRWTSFKDRPHVELQQWRDLPTV